MFTLKPEEVDFEKIESFCKEKIPEGETVEYKRALPSDPAKLAKGISAMANTHGGIILIGVKANKTTNTPIMPIQGIKLTEGLEEKITSICLRNIYQPYFPSVKICDFKNEKGEDRAVVFIRVYESDQTPHAINNNTDVYLRIKSQNEPFRKATLDEIEWLKDKRQKSVELRESLLSRADERYNTLKGGILGELRKRRFRKSFVIPLYCSGQLIPCYDLFDHLNELEGFGFDLQIRNLKQLAKTANETLYYFGTSPGERQSTRHVQYGEFNTYGLILRKESFWEDCYPKVASSFAVDSLLQQIHQTFKLGLLFYSTIGFQGLIRAGVLVQGLLNRDIIRMNQEGTMIDECIVKSDLEDRFSSHFDFSVMEFEERLDSIILEIYKRFLFACGLGKDKNLLDSLSAKHYDLVKAHHKT